MTGVVRAARRAAIPLTVLVAAVGAGAATAGTMHYPTIFTSYELQGDTSSGGTFKGTIDSTKGKCVKGREIKLFRKHNGDQKTLGDDKTNDNGHFKIDVSASDFTNGRYYAKAKSKTFDGGQKKCNSARSGTVQISGVG
jgi:5-hydroxyisourate hydrolase-like protein (transthyretin family)